MVADGAAEEVEEATEEVAEEVVFVEAGNSTKLERQTPNPGTTPGIPLQFTDSQDPPRRT